MARWTAADVNAHLMKSKHPDAKTLDAEIRKNKRAARPKRTSAPVPMEKDIQKAIMDRLKWLPGVSFERQNTGAVSVPSVNGSKARHIRFSEPGAPDIRCYVDGKALAIEVKRPGGRQRPSQAEWQAKHAAGGVVYRIVTSIEEALAAVEEMRRR